ncbi:MAG: class I SAM-dependent methyltransferase [Vulcanimicrobiota bacterium]
MDLKELSIVESGGKGGLEVRHPWELARLEILKTWLADFSLEEGFHLDVGCGDAFLLRALAELHPESRWVGVDSAFSALENVDSGDLPNLELVSSLEGLSRSSRFNSVLLMDVLEHIEEPLELLLDLHRRELLAEDALIIITVPAFPAIFSSHDHFLGHFRRYTLASLTDLFQKAGLEPLEQGYFFSSLLAARAGECLGERFRNASTPFKGVARWTGGPMLTAAITHFLVHDFALGRWFRRRLGLHLPGLSCFAICRVQPHE